jgi:hypothetical protein
MPTSLTHGQHRKRRTSLPLKPLKDHAGPQMPAVSLQSQLGRLLNPKILRHGQTSLLWNLSQNNLLQTSPNQNPTIKRTVVAAVAGPAPTDPVVVLAAHRIPQWNLLPILLTRLSLMNPQMNSLRIHHQLIHDQQVPHVTHVAGTRSVVVVEIANHVAHVLQSSQPLKPAGNLPERNILTPPGVSNALQVVQSTADTFHVWNANADPANQLGLQVANSAGMNDPSVLTLTSNRSVLSSPIPNPTPVLIPPQSRIHA